jgi:hypothetical protein
MTLDPVRRAILRVAVDDYWGMWELLPEIRAALPASSASLLNDAREIVRQMLSEGLLRLVVRDGPLGDPIAAEPPLTDLLIEDDRTWVAPDEGRTQVLVCATRAGESAYYGSGPGPESGT